MKKTVTKNEQIDELKEKILQHDERYPRSEIQNMLDRQLEVLKLGVQARGVNAITHEELSRYAHVIELRTSQSAQRRTLTTELSYLMGNENYARWNVIERERELKRRARVRAAKQELDSAKMAVKAAEDQVRLAETGFFPVGGFMVVPAAK